MVVWLYEEDDGSLQMLDEDVLVKLRATPQMRQACRRKMKSGGTTQYFVDGPAMTCTNTRSKKCRTMHRKVMRQVMLDQPIDLSATMNGLRRDQWELSWQVEDDWGWKRMGLAANQTLLDALGGPHEIVQIRHD